MEMSGQHGAQCMALQVGLEGEGRAVLSPVFGVASCVFFEI